MNAVDAAEIKRLKKKWGEEWEHARALEENAREIEGGEFLAKKLRFMHLRWYTTLSPPTRAAYREFRRLEALDKEGGHAWVNDPARDPNETAEQAFAEYNAPLGPGHEDDRPEVWKLIDVEHGADVLGDEMDGDAAEEDGPAGADGEG